MVRPKPDLTHKTIVLSDHEHMVILDTPAPTECVVYVNDATQQSNMACQ